MLAEDPRLTPAYCLDPLADPRWRDLVESHPLASVFHTVPWLESIARTYGYKPVAFTCSPPGEKLQSAVVFCKVCSWLTGRRLVSLPFSDHCDPLCGSLEEVERLFRRFRTALGRDAWRYIELRPTHAAFVAVSGGFAFSSQEKYYLHRIALHPETDAIFKALDKDSVQRRIQRAERAQLVEECGSSQRLLNDFFALLILTRSRHQLPPQPYLWFQNLVKTFGEALQIRVAYNQRTPVAAILTLRFRDTAYYKYGCSDKAFNHLGATPLILWRAIAHAKSTGAATFDLGRSDADNPGLIAFKNKWGACPQPLLYLRLSDSPLAEGEKWKLRLLKQVFARMPSRMLQATGALIYRHIG